MRENEKSMKKWTPAIIYLIVWGTALIVFWFFTSGSDAMGYALIYFWILLPLSTFFLSLVIGRSRRWGNGKWIWALFFGAMYMLADYLTFRLANMKATGILRSPLFSLLGTGVLISLAGLLVGWRMRKNKSRAAGR